MSMPRLPLFVYGTLVPCNGFANFEKVLSKRVSLFPPDSKQTEGYTVATAAGYKVFHLEGFPGVQRGNMDDVVVGALVYPTGTDAEYVETIMEADRLENYNGIVDDPSNEYRRIEITTTVLSTTEEPKQVRAWIYECLLDLSERQRILHGDWPKFMKENNLKDAADDWSDLHAASSSSLIAS